MIDYSKIEYFVIDVDGTMTDAGIYYDDAGIYGIHDKSEYQTR